MFVEHAMTVNGSYYRSHRFQQAPETHGARQILKHPYRSHTYRKAECFIQTARAIGPTSGRNVLDRPGPRDFFSFTRDNR